MHLAAESHVDRSIDNPKEYLDTNIYGTYVLLEEARNIFSKGKKVLFHQVSTDEVYGDLHDIENAFTETSAIGRYICMGVFTQIYLVFATSRIAKRPMLLSLFDIWLTTGPRRNRLADKTS